VTVIAILAIGMTLVVISGGIDLSVGSLIALSAVICARLIRDYGGAEEAGVLALILCSLAAIAVCAACGAFSAAMVTQFRVPPFIVTLAVMMMASGFAMTIADGQSINRIPASFQWLGRGTIGQVPNAVTLMVALYIGAHVLMTRSVFGRYIYAVGGNSEAARLSGVPVQSVLIAVYTLCGALAGLGGVILCSQFQSGAPTYGLMYEMYVIAAVVVGGASLSGGEGRVFGTLIGAFVIAVIQNGMNLMSIPSNGQRIVLGSVILAGVLLDKLKSRV
jgi:ribose transport system permease protein